MSDLIKREDAINALYSEKRSLLAMDADRVARGVQASIKVVESLPSADRPQGEWIYTMNPLRLNDEWECSKCGYLSFTKANYCGHCGCRMKGADDDN